MIRLYYKVLVGRNTRKDKKVFCSPNLTSSTAVHSEPQGLGRAAAVFDLGGCRSRRFACQCMYVGVLERWDPSHP